jgi:hypothetical protein
MTPGGIDILILRGPSLEAIHEALATACGLTAAEIVGPDQDILDRLDVLQRPLRAKIFRLQGGDFDFKVDIDGLTPRDYLALARVFAIALGHGIVVPDESKPDPISSILLRAHEPDVLGSIEDAEPDGMWFRSDGSPYACLVR